MGINGGLTPSPDDIPPLGPKTKSLVVLFKYQRDENWDPIRADVTLEAKLYPEDDIVFKKIRLDWSKVSGGEGGDLRNITNNNRTAAFSADPSTAGLFVFQTTSNKGPSVVSCILLPKAGGEIKDWMASEVPRIKAAAFEWDKEVYKYAVDRNISPEAYLLEQFTLIAAFRFDYQGLALTGEPNVPTRRYSYTESERVAAGYQLERESNGDWDEPSYCTLGGIVIHRSKVSNWGLAVMAKDIGIREGALLGGANVNQITRTLELDGPSSQASVRLGFEMWEMSHVEGSDLRTLITRDRAKLLQSGTGVEENNDTLLYPSTIPMTYPNSEDSFDTPFLEVEPIANDPLRQFVRRPE